MVGPCRLSCEGRVLMNHGVCTAAVHGKRLVTGRSSCEVVCVRVTECCREREQRTREGRPSSTHTTRARREGEHRDPSDRPLAPRPPCRIPTHVQYRTCPYVKSQPGHRQTQTSGRFRYMYVQYVGFLTCTVQKCQVIHLKCYSTINTSTSTAREIVRSLDPSALHHIRHAKKYRIRMPYEARTRYTEAALTSRTISCDIDSAVERKDESAHTQGAGSRRLRTWAGTAERPTVSNLA